MGEVKDVKDRKGKFASAYKTFSGRELSEQDITTMIKALSHLGIVIRDLFSETDSTKLRLYLSELIVKRSICGIESSAEYIAACTTLLTYIEYLEHPDNIFNVQQTEMPLSRNKTMDSLTVAYYLSRFNKDALIELGYSKYTAAFEGLGKVMQQKPSTLKNMRDEFDPYFDNGRKGWYQKPLVGSRKEIFEKYSKASFNIMTDIVNIIVNAYKSIADNEIKEEDGHRKIKISSKNMKEINSKRRK